MTQIDLFFNVLENDIEDIAIEAAGLVRNLSNHQRDGSVSLYDTRSIIGGRYFNFYQKVEKVFRRLLHCTEIPIQHESMTASHRYHEGIIEALIDERSPFKAAFFQGSVLSSLHEARKFCNLYKQSRARDDPWILNDIPVPSMIARGRAIAEALRLACGLAREHAGKNYDQSVLDRVTEDCSLGRMPSTQGQPRFQQRKIKWIYNCFEDQGLEDDVSAEGSAAVLEETSSSSASIVHEALKDLELLLEYVPTNGRAQIEFLRTSSVLGWPAVGHMMRLLSMTTWVPQLSDLLN